jgi:hypothetical protein
MMTILARDFVRAPVPPSPSREWTDWQQRCRALGPESIPVFLDVLENGEEAEQYSALLALRLFGYEAFGEGYGPELCYRVKEPGATDARLIRPKITPEPFR